MDLPEILDRLNKIEEAFLSGLQEIRFIREEVRKRVNQSPRLEPLLDMEQLAKILGLRRSFIYIGASSGKIPSVKIGKYLRFSPAQIKKWLER
ncbi:MAG: helix-turn-helix domain-containing protein [Deltaproteobacteria bacterium]|nr:helix-turn-helix domain-containing protein [Deltaproteobacteria bacterium]